MHIDELVQLIHAVDKKRGGCTITLTTTNVPPAGAQPYGYVTIGAREYQQVFHNVEELRDILKRKAQ